MTSEKFRERARLLSARIERCRVDLLDFNGVGERTRDTLDAAEGALNAAVVLMDVAMGDSNGTEFAP